MTYQQVASAPDLFAHHLARPTFVVLDEVHHAGESATWGTALRAAFDGAQHRLALSGTPFRSDARAIPFVRYDDERRCAPDFVYGYGEAVSDDVCRPLAFRLLDATLRWRVDAQETIAAFADELDPTDDARRLRTAIDPSTPLLPQMLRDADALLTKARAVDPRRGRPRALRRPRPRPRDRGAPAHDRRREAGRRGQRRAAGARPDRPLRPRRRDAPRWLVAVNMVSEGVDVPRLILAAYATVKRTDLFFRQAVGRVVRRRASDPADLVATVFLPADPTLKGCAERVEVELRQQVSDEVGADFDVEPPPGLAHRPDFQPLDAQVEPGGMIVAGVHYARDEVDAARRLLRELGHPSERCAPCSSSSAASASAAPHRRRRRCPPIAASSTSAARSTASPAAGRSSGARSTRLHLATGPGTRQPRDGRRAAAPTPASPSSTPASTSCARADQALPRLPRAGRAAPHPGSVEGIDQRLGEKPG